MTQILIIRGMTVTTTVSRISLSICWSRIFKNKD